MRAFALLLALLSSALVLAAGSGLGGGAADGKLLTERHCYLLQAKRLGKRDKALEKLAAFNADTFVLDAYYETGDEEGRYRPEELERIRSGGVAAGGSRARVLLAYLSIGEAEDYRLYWNEAWDEKRDGTPDPGAPAWLVSENPQWAGNYVVKYWNKDWQALIFGSPEAALDKIMAQGFDGVYLDIIDGFETFENGTEHALNPETAQSYRRDMVDFVMALAAHARASKPGFLIVPQNGSQLLDEDDYCQSVSGIGQEDLYTDGKLFQPDDEKQLMLARLKKLTASGKAVLATDYVKSKKARAQVFVAAAADAFSIYIGPRALNKLGVTAP